MNYLVIDLEMCRVPRDFRSKNYKYANETIQIGAVLLDDEFKRIGTLSQYVCPEHGVIDPYIQNLTGISNGCVKKAPKIQEALIHLIDWIGDREYKVYAWSSTDRDQIMHEVNAKHIGDARINAFMEEDRWIDYQAVFSKRYEFDRCLSLQEALERADIDAEGRFHDGLDDAVNTGYLIEKLEMNPDFQLVSYEIPEKDKAECFYSLGELFAGLNLQFA
jgi:inhibitor of KinA sporulation pathway (predicted exonuclease)